MTTSVTSAQQLALVYTPPRDNGTEVALSPTPDDAPPETTMEHLSLFGEDGFEFSDLIDIVNPLHHIPFVSTMYRDQTGDDLGAVARVAGATLFFGPIGLASSLANVFIEGSTGKDMGAHVADWVLPDDGAENIADAAAEPSENAAVDPVSAWARQEVAWAQSHANTWAPPPADTPAPAVPDAAPHVQQVDRMAAVAPATHTETGTAARLTDDIRSAAWAYRAAAGLTGSATNPGIA